MMRDVKVHYKTTDKDKRKYAYEKAIEAYWKHVDRYHTWMNYYALFDGALLVAYCTLLCATNIILTANGQFEIKDLFCKSGVLFLENNYEYYLILVSILGLIVSILWLLSILGHNAWTNSWMKIIEKYEMNPLYSLVILDSKYNTKDHKLQEPFDQRAMPLGFSTSKITIIFISFVIIAWICTIIMQISIQICVLIIVLMVLLLAVCIILSCVCKNTKGLLIWLLYSDISNKKREYR